MGQRLIEVLDLVARTLTSCAKAKATSKLKSTNIVCCMWMAVLLGACAGSETGSIVEDGLDVADQDLVLFIQQKIDAARSESQSALRRGQLGMAYEANGFHDAAEVTYRQASDLDPSDFRWFYFRAVTLIKLVRLEEALLDLDNAMAIDPAYVPAILTKGELLLDLDRFAKALTVYGQAVDLSRHRDTSAAGKIGLARGLLRQDDATAAAALLEELHEGYPHPHVIRLLRTAKRRLGEPVTDDVVASTAITWPDPRQQQKREYLRGAMGRLLAAEKLMEADRPDEAIILLEPLVADNPDDVDLINNLAAAYRASDRLEEAHALLEKGLTIDPDVYQFHYNIASIHKHQREPGRALEHIDHALRLMPTLAVAHRDRIDLLVSLDRSDEVQAALAVAEKVGAVDSDTLYYAGLYFGAREDWETTIEYLDRVVVLEPQRGKAHLYLAHAMMNVGRFREAASALSAAEENGVSTRSAEVELQRRQQIETQP